MNNKNKKNKYLFAVFLFFILFHSIIFAIDNKNQGNPEHGATLFKKECTACHSINLSEKLIGPALNNITKKRNRTWLHLWIKNNQALRKSGDKDAISIYKEYNGIEMNNFLHLSKNDIDDILTFIEHPIIPKQKNNIVINTNQENTINELFKIILIGFIILTIFLIIILIKICILIKTINNLDLTNYKSDIFKIINIIKHIIYYKSIIYILLFITSLVSIYSIWDFLMNLDINKGYKPIQPIYFSHKIHSGINKIDCQYCHSTAKYSKIAGIPSANICMNCHTTIKEYKGEYIEKGKNKSFYDQEIKKLYQAVGWNSETMTFSKNIHPIKWIKIHNMPDFVYFDHSQHIVIGESAIKKNNNVDIVCTACHGNVKNMDEIEMANNFTMQWCIDCHRTIEINHQNNYYKHYFDKTIHKFLKINKHNNKETKITLEKIGGIECGKCHY